MPDWCTTFSASYLCLLSHQLVSQDTLPYRLVVNKIVCSATLCPYTDTKWHQIASYGEHQIAAYGNASERAALIKQQYLASTPQSMLWKPQDGHPLVTQ